LSGGTWLVTHIWDFLVNIETAAPIVQIVFPVLAVDLHSSRDANRLMRERAKVAAFW